MAILALIALLYIPFGVTCIRLVVLSTFTVADSDMLLFT